MLATTRALARVLVPSGVGFLWACGSVTAPTPSKPTPQPSSISVAGIVVDSAFRPLADSLIEVTDGASARVSTRSDAAGAFALGGLAMGAKLRVSKDGYSTSERLVQVSFLEVVLTPDGQKPAANITGRYTLTVDADPSCTDLPAEVSHRGYAATIIPDDLPSWPANTLFRAVLSGAGLDAYFHFVPVHFAGDVVGVDMSDNGIEEEIGENTYVFIGGVGKAALAPDGVISGPIAGVFDYCVVGSEPGTSYPCSDQARTRVRCRGTHRITLTPQ